MALVTVFVHCSFAIYSDLITLYPRSYAFVFQQCVT
jgi:hypothetical protein